MAKLQGRISLKLPDRLSQFASLLFDPPFTCCFALPLVGRFALRFSLSRPLSLSLTNLSFSFSPSLLLFLSNHSFICCSFFSVFHSVSLSFLILVCTFRTSNIFCHCSLLSCSLSAAADTGNSNKLLSPSTKSS